MIGWGEGVLADYPDVLEAADEPAGEVASGPARLVRPIGTNPGLRVSYDPVERSVFEGLLEQYWDLFMEERCLQSTAWNFTDLECGSAAVSAALDSTGGERL